MPTTLTDSNVKALRPRTSAYFVWDSQAVGLAVRVTPPGRKIWIVQLKFPGQAAQSKRTLGQHPGIDVDAARGLARQWRDLIKVGTDPKAIEADQRKAAELARQHTFGKVAETYIEGRTNRRADKDAKAIRRHLIEAWADKPIATILPRDVRTLIGGIAARAPFEAKNAWGHAVLIFKWAVNEELIEASPCASLDKKHVLGGAKLAPRKRVLDDDECMALWRACEARGWPEGHAVRWLMLTGCRLGEALGASWREFHPELRRALREGGKNLGHLTDAQRVWTIPAERFKSDEVHMVPLTSAMLDMLATVPVRSGGDLVFSHTGEKQLGSLSKLKWWIDRHMTGTLSELAAERGDDAPTLAPWVMHDLRRVVRTNLSALGVADNVAEMTIGHGKKGLQRVYDQHRYLPEIRDALMKWNDRLLVIAMDDPNSSS